MRLVEKPLEELAVIRVLDQAKNEVFRGDIYAVREWIEEQIEEKIDVFVSLQENFETDEKLYEIYVHTDAYEDCSEEEIDVFSSHGLTDSPEECTTAIEKLLGVTMEFSHYDEENKYYQYSS